VSKHVGVLERAGLIERGRTAQRRPSRLRADKLEDVVEWLDTYRGFWEGSFDRLDQHLRSHEKADQAEAAPACLSHRLPTEDYDRAQQGWGTFFDRIAKRLAS
jgi:hypothetical protein